MKTTVPSKGQIVIAATAIVHGLAIVTRNRADFAHIGARIVDPFVG